jgi:circadian clock protein KaiC
MATEYAVAAAQRGERAAIYVFDESVETFVNRSASLGIAIAEHMASGRLTLRRLDPAELPPGQFDHLVCKTVEDEHARVVVIDSLNGYFNAMAEERAVLVQLHELLTYLGQQGVVTILTIAQHGLVGEHPTSPIDVSYLADTVVLLRYFEAAGELRQAISVVKKRSGAHERSIRELQLGPGLRLGPPLHDFQGVLAGAPTFLGSARSLFSDVDA